MTQNGVSPKIFTFALSFMLMGSALLVNPWSTTDIFEFPKLVLLIVLVGFLTITTFVDFSVHGAPKFSKLPKEFIFIILLLAGEILAYVFSTNRGISLMGAPFRFQGFLTNIHYLLLLAVSYFFFLRNPREKTEGVFLWITVGLIASAIISLLPYALPPFTTSPLLWFHPSFFYDRVYGTFGNPNYFAAFIIAALPFLAVYIYAKKRWIAIFGMLSLILVLVTLFLTGARSAWIASAIGFLIWGIFRVVKKQGIVMLAVTLGIIFLAGGAMVFENRLPSAPLERLSIRSENLTSLKTRFALWQAGFKLFLAHPLTGVGQDAIKNNIEPYLPERLKANEVFFIDRTHSEFIDILATRGIFAFLGYVGFFLILLIKGARLLLSSAVSDLRFAAVFFSLLSLLLFESVNFSTITSNILLAFLGGYLLWYNRKIVL